MNDDGQEVFSHEEIEQAHVHFYSTLFSPEIIDESCKQQLLNGLSRTLSEDDRGLCEEPLSLVELTAFVKGLSLGKSPGADGLTVEFYCLF